MTLDLDCDYLTDTHLSEVFSNKNNGWEADAVAPCLLKRVVGESCDGWGGWMRGDCGEHWRLQLTVDTGPGEQSQPDHQLSSWNKDSEDDSDDVTDTMKKNCVLLYRHVSISEHHTLTKIWESSLCNSILNSDLIFENLIFLNVKMKLIIDDRKVWVLKVKGFLFQSKKIAKFAATRFTEIRC